VQSRVIIKSGLIPPWAHIEGISEDRRFRGQTDVFNNKVNRIDIEVRFNVIPSF
jgi:hypothetical protein